MSLGVDPDDPQAADDQDEGIRLANSVLSFGEVRLGGIAAPLRMVPKGFGAAFDGVEVLIPIETAEKITAFVNVYTGIEKDRMEKQ